MLEPKTKMFRSLIYTHDLYSAHNYVPFMEKCIVTVVRTPMWRTKQYLCTIRITIYLCTIIVYATRRVTDMTVLCSCTWIVTAKKNLVKLTKIT